MAVKGNIKENSVAQKSGLGSFFKGVKSEFNKITWPKKEDTKKAFVAVGVVVLIYMVLVGAFDFIFQNLFELIFTLK